jgi:hypothetical protein
LSEIEEEYDMKKLINTRAPQSKAILNELFCLLDCSLARYLANARPWCRRPYLLLGAVARGLAIEHEHYAGAIARLLHERREDVNCRAYPMEFTYYNDLSLEYLAPRLLEHQSRLIDIASAASEKLSDDYEARHIAEKLVKSLRKYAVLLAELLAPQRLAPVTEKRRLPGAAATRSGSPAESQAAA